MAFTLLNQKKKKEEEEEGEGEEEEEEEEEEQQQQQQQQQEKTRNTFGRTWYLPHSHVHNERTVPIIMAGCMLHAQNFYISTFGLKSDVTIVFLDPDFR